MLMHVANLDFSDVIFDKQSLHGNRDGEFLAQEMIWLKLMLPMPQTHGVGVFTKCAFYEEISLRIVECLDYVNLPSLRVDAGISGMEVQKSTLQSLFLAKPGSDYRPDIIAINA